MDISVIVPLYNEEESLPELYAWIERVMKAHNYSFEVIFVNDGSTDTSWEVIQRLSKESENVKGIKFRRNYGKSPALYCGFKEAKGKVVITMDADLQDSPDEIPELYKMVTDCPNAERMYADRYRYGEWRCGGCCRECLSRDTCSSACRFVVAERPPKEPESAVPRNPAADDPRLKNMTPKFCERVKALREATGLTRKEFAESIGEYPGTYSAWENNSLAGAGSLPKLALTLGTTMDYLCGLTDDPAQPETASEPEWLPLDEEHWPTEGALVVQIGRAHV